MPKDITPERSHSAAAPSSADAAIAGRQQSVGGIDPEYIGSYTRPHGTVSIGRGEAHDYANTRAAQLAALLHLTIGDSGEVFRNKSAHIQDWVMFLASDLADEMVQLLALVANDAREGGAQ